jgi:hypothetical protein
VWEGEITRWALELTTKRKIETTINQKFENEEREVESRLVVKIVLKRLDDATKDPEKVHCKLKVTWIGYPR